MRRFFAPDADASEGTLELDAEQSSHLVSVLRLKEGERIAVFDGAGHEFECRIAKASKSGTLLSVTGRIDPPSPESPLRLTLALSLLKNDKFDLVVQKAVELGVSRLVPVETERSDVPIKGAEKRLDRWRKISVEASKQCGRALLMEVSSPVVFSDLLEGIEGPSVMFTERSGGPLREVAVSDSMTVMIGPEGGWTDEEIQAAESSGAALVTLKGRILRAETAAITAAALIQHLFGDLG